MKTKQSQLLKLHTPVIFTDGTSLFERFKKEYGSHKKGFFILAPSGAGKTHFIVNQKKKEWIDGDDLWKAAKAHPKDGWWLERGYIKEIDRMSDIITFQAKNCGLWIMGASNDWLPPDAIVIPHWSTHKKYIWYRETHNYDGGATSDRLNQVLSHRKEIGQWAKKGVPKFRSVEAAVRFLTKNGRL